jgi:hypothetical protein
MGEVDREELRLTFLRQERYRGAQGFQIDQVVLLELGRTCGRKILSS